MSFDVSVNFWAVLTSAVASMVIGSIWYGPLFGKQFMQAMGMHLWTPEQRQAMTKSMTLSYAVQFLASVATIYIFGWLMAALGAVFVMDYIQGAIWVWLGFMLPIKLGDALWGG